LEDIVNLVGMACAGMLLLGSGAAGQATTGSISGAVLDETRARLPGATVEAVRLETGIVRTATSDERGRYRLLDLAPGSYRLTARLAGFGEIARDALLVEIGRDLEVDVVLTVGPVAETVSVRDRANGPALGGVVAAGQIEQLPLNGRSFTQLATLQPGVVVSRATSRDFTGGYGATQLSIGGARPEHTGYLLDGTNIADISDKAPSSLAGVLLGVDTVQEFSVQTHGYAAEFGRAAGGVVSAVTRSGTNQFRGSAFEFHRDSALDARNAFDVAEPPEFRRNQFGGSLGGPVLRGRLFFFSSYEGLRDRQAVTRYARLPNADAHRGLVPNAAGVLQPVGVHPEARPYLDLLFPIPTGEDFGDGTAEQAHAHQEPVDEDFGLGKIDWHPTTRDALMVRLSKDRSDATVFQEHPLFVETRSSGTRFLAARHQRLIGARTLNEVRAAANRTSRSSDVLPLVVIPTSLYFTEDPHWGAINISGLSTAGSTSTVPVDYRQDVFQLSDTLTVNRGRHTWKLGGDWQRYAFDGSSYSRYGGEFRFRSLTEFLTLRRSSTAQADRFTGNLPGTDTFRQVRQHYAAFFVQDEWRLSDTATMMAGLRYEFVTVPREVAGRMAGLRSLDDLASTPDGVTPGTPLFRNPSTRSVAPRLGLTWRPSPASRLTLRTGWGIFHQPLTVSFYRGTIFRIYPWYAGVDIRQPAVFGPGNIEVLADGISPASVQKRSEFIDYDLRQPYLQQWHAVAQADLGGGVVGELGYTGSKGSNLPFYGDPNAVPSETLPDGTKRIVPGAELRYPSWGRVRTRTTTARSLYHGLVAGMTKRLSGGSMLQVSYTFGNARDTWSGGQNGNSDFDNGPGSAVDWFDPEYEWGPSNFDVRHTLVANAVYALPSPTGGLAGALGAGWHVAGLLELASGLPFTPIVGFDRAGDEQSDEEQQRPDLASPIVYTRTATQWFDPASFTLPAPGLFGTASRNSIRAAGVGLVDLSMFRNVGLGRATLQVRLEAFNAFNRVNLGLPAAMLFNADGTRFSGAGRITSTSTAARQLQLGLKVMF
jgi:Carboxypeptidase regulatory-like domain/TonB dependent receptor-like, beta-barrel